MSGDFDPARGEPEDGPAPGATPLGLDPDLAAQTARRAGGSSSKPTPVIDTRRYGWMVGGVGLIIVVVISVVSFLQHGVVTAGVPAHQRLRYFAAPLAASNLAGDANVAHPTCSLARHDPRALNVCLLVKRAPLVLAFFVAGGKQCTQEVDAMQIVARQIPSVQFAAVAVKTGHAAAAKIVRRHGWTIPVAYDADGAVGYQYGVAVCPLVELAYRGGIVQARLIGDHWARPAALAQRVRRLEASAPR
ncbi:MAG: redoxin domain-containing protein [Actinomycetota bacterium]|nr:redoxin domain-containing protein [Actinomycetota bacterium]